MGCTALRLGSLLAAGVLCVHELRYRAAFGRDATDALADHGHGYLEALMPLLGVTLALAAGGFIARWARGGELHEPRQSGLRLWALLSAALFVVYCSEELLEGALANGHPTGVAAVVGQGGWSALVFAVVVGGAIAALVGRARAVLESARGVSLSWRPPFTSLTDRTPVEVLLIAGRVAGRNLAVRGPPAHLLS